MNRDRFFDMRKPRDTRPKAAALVYDPVKTKPPEIVATGRGLVADEIISLAKKHKIPIHADRGLVEALSRLELGAVIPRDLYVVVAEILAWVYRLDTPSSEPTNVTPER